MWHGKEDNSKGGFFKVPQTEPKMAKIEHENGNNFIVPCGNIERRLYVVFPHKTWILEVFITTRYVGLFHVPLLQTLFQLCCIAARMGQATAFVHKTDKAIRELHARTMVLPRTTVHRKFYRHDISARLPWSWSTCSLCTETSGQTHAT